MTSYNLFFKNLFHNLQVFEKFAALTADVRFVALLAEVFKWSQPTQCLILIDGSTSICALQSAQWYLSDWLRISLRYSKERCQWHILVFYCFGCTGKWLDDCRKKECNQLTFVHLVYFVLMSLQLSKGFKSCDWPYLIFCLTKPCLYHTKRE